MAYIYALSNASMPGLIKIGQTIKHPDKRAGELSTTGVPEPFVVVGFWRVSKKNLNGIERGIHRHLSEFRQHSNREFFKLSPNKAKILISKFVDQQEELERKTNIKKEKEKREDKRRKRQEELNRIYYDEIERPMIDAICNNAKKFEDYFESVLPSKEVIDKTLVGREKRTATNIRWHFYNFSISREDMHLAIVLRYQKKIAFITLDEEYWCLAYSLDCKKNVLGFAKGSKNERRKDILLNSKLPKTFEQLIERIGVKEAVVLNKRLQKIEKEMDAFL